MLSSEPNDREEMTKSDDVLQVADKIGSQRKSDDKPVDPDFAARLFDNVKDVSDQDMQRLWDLAPSDGRHLSLL